MVQARSQWDVLSPLAGLMLNRTAPMFSQCSAELLKVAGVKERQGVWRVPFNAITAVEQHLIDFGVQVTALQWLQPPVSLQMPAWEQIEQVLVAGGEVRAEFLGSFTMFYQKEALQFGWLRNGVNFWHPTGSGKTYTGILCALSAPGAIVIVTRGQARVNYAREVTRFTHLRPFVLYPAGQTKVKETKRKRRKIVPQTYAEYLASCAQNNTRPVVIVGWENLVSQLDNLSQLNIGTVIYDEVHRGKNSKRWDVVPLPALPEDAREASRVAREQEMAAREKGGFIKSDPQSGRMLLLPHVSMATAAAQLARKALKRVGTTATPVKNRTCDLYSQLDIIEPNAWGSSTAWLDRYADRRPGAYGGFKADGTSNAPELKLRLSTCCHILDYNVTHRDLPPKRRQSVYLSAEEQCAPSAGLVQELNDAEKRGATARVEVELAIAASRKRKAVLEDVRSHLESGQKITIFTGRRKDCESLHVDIRKLTGNDYPVWMAHGGVSAQDRQRTIDDYMAYEGPCVLIATGQSLGESINLHTTDVVIFLMLPPDPGQLRQWEGRFSRRGQRRPVIIYYWIAEGTRDEHIAALLISKLPAVEQFAEDHELAAARDILAGYDSMDKENFAQLVLSDLDF